MIIDMKCHEMTWKYTLQNRFCLRGAEDHMEGDEEETRQDGFNDLRPKSL